MIYGNSSLGSVTIGGNIGFERLIMNPPAFVLNLAISEPLIWADIVIAPPAFILDLNLSESDALIKNYYLSKVDGYTTDSLWKHLAFKVSGPGFKSQINSIKVETEPLNEGARCDFVLNYNKAQRAKVLNPVIYDSNNLTKTKFNLLSKGPQVEDFRLDWSFAQGSTIHPVRIRSIEIKGHYIQDN